MKAGSFAGGRGVFFAGFLFLIAATGRAEADSVEMRNGDRYVGTVVAMDAAHLKLKNENLGLLKIDRQKVAVVRFGEANPAPASNVTQTSAIQAPSPTNLVATVEKIAQGPVSKQTAIDQVRNEFLATATPEANQMFNSTLQGVLAGQLSVGDIRAQAQSAATEIRKLQKDLGSDGDALDAYLSILDHFLVETRNVAPATKAINVAQ